MERKPSDAEDLHSDEFSDSGHPEMGAFSLSGDEGNVSKKRAWD